MHETTGLCEGCARSIDEIAAWGQMDASAKEEVWLLLPERHAQLRRWGVSPQVPAVPCP